MKRGLASALVCCAVVLAAGASPAGATTECRGFMVCVPVAGPWVVVPRSVSVPRAIVEYQLTCPRRYVVGGLDAELSDRAIDVAFVGRLGSPVNPGISTSRSVVVVGRYVGSAARTTSFRPHVGCIPGRGAGRRVPTVATRVYPPGRSVARHVLTIRVRPGQLHGTVGCAAGERLVAASHAVGFYTPGPPAEDLVQSVSAIHAVRKGRVVLTGHAATSVGRVRAVVQMHAVCAGGE